MVQVIPWNRSKITPMNSTDPAYNDLSQLLSSFEPITLEEMDGVKLLDRVDIKFAFNYNRLPLILNGLQEHYRILDVNGVKQNSYETLYFDTPDFKLYHDHHNCRANRYKVRYRKYVESNLKFFEVKYRNNKGRTVKSRVRRKNINEVIDAVAQAGISKPVVGLKPIGNIKG